MRIRQTTTVEPVTPDYLRAGEPHILQGKDIPPDVTILRIHGPFLFGATEQLTEATRDIEIFEPIVILRPRDMTALDATGPHAIEQLADRLHGSGRALLLCGARPAPPAAPQRSWRRPAAAFAARHSPSHFRLRSESFPPPLYAAGHLRFIGLMRV